MSLKALSYPEIKKRNPKRFEFINGKLVFELDNGERVALACDNCGKLISTTNIQPIKADNRIAFVTFCSCGKGNWLVSIQPKE